MFLNWTESGSKDLKQIRKYYCNEVPDGNEIGKEIVDQILLTTSQLKHHPFIGRPGRIPGTKELLVKDTPYIVYYEVMENKINLLRVIHTSRLLQVAFYDSP
ncbi:type II toxin-antitoxin system RelE/ParE family toxin [Desulfovibrio sp. OttesenSCG-928-C14]|nr:type II toxin-antitoxin system RelE/ParE family toxin [Desulfovibrio sp. OttesenSCG-928-C14]